jgi:hypothetical protein
MCSGWKSNIGLKKKFAKGKEKKKKKCYVFRFFPAHNRWLNHLVPTEIITLNKGIQTSDVQETNP